MLGNPQVSISSDRSGVERLVAMVLIWVNVTRSLFPDEVSWVIISAAKWSWVRNFSTQTQITSQRQTSWTFNINLQVHGLTIPIVKLKPDALVVRETD